MHLAEKGPPKKFEFGICGLDVTFPKEELKDLFQAPEGCHVEPIAGFQLAYQGFPWKRGKGYEEGSEPKTEAGRRYEHGETYPAWHEIDAMIAAMPGTKLSFHFNETDQCKYVSWLLEGEEEMLKLIHQLCTEYKARHIQININARGLDPKLFTDETSQQKSAAVIAGLAAKYPETIFLLPVFKRGDTHSWPFVLEILKKSVVDGKPLSNLSAFFDNSGGEGKEPDKVPEIPLDYPDKLGQPVGFTGGIKTTNVKEWLTKYEQQAAAHGCWCISDAQSGFREAYSRGKPIDKVEVKKLMNLVFEWGMM